jgi:hypothetical protein
MSFFWGEGERDEQLIKVIRIRRMVPTRARRQTDFFRCRALNGLSGLNELKG